MNLASAPEQYDPSDQRRLRAALEQADRESFKKGRDVELARGERLILKSPNGARWSIGVDDTGALSASPA
jgi:hypothetical protein